MNEKPNSSKNINLPAGLPPDLVSISDDNHTLKSVCQDTEETSPRIAVSVQSNSWPQIEGYDILKKLGQGGMGSVYLAKDNRLGRQVAIKIVAQIFRDTAALRERFDSEIQSLAGLQHTYIAQLYSAGQHCDLPFFVMEYVDGPNLEQLAREPMKSSQVADIASKLCEAISFCHGREILHRDLKPANVLMTQSGQPKIADFGLAKSLGTDSSSTRTGEILGTPGYMAPEQASGVVKTLTEACDIYSLGAIIYRCLTGRPPFLSDDPLHTVMMVISEEPVRPRKLVGTIPLDLETICLKCLEKNPHRRYRNVDALLEDLRRFSDGRPILARPASIGEKIWKWTRRNPTAALATVGSCLAMVAGVIGLSVHNNRLTKELNRSRRLANHGSELSKWIIDDHLTSLNTISGTTDSRHRLMQQVKDFLDKSFEDMPRDAIYTRRLGSSYGQLASISGGSDQNNVGDLAAAEENYLRALELFEQAEQQGDDPLKINKLRCETHLSLGDLYIELQQVKNSERSYELAAETFSLLTEQDWETRFLRIRLLNRDFHRNLEAHQSEPALKSLKDIELILDQAGPDANPLEIENQRIMIAAGRGQILEALGKLEDSEKEFQTAADLAKASRDQKPTDALRNRRLASSLVQLGDIQFARLNMEQTQANYQTALAIVLQLAEQDPKSIELQVNLAQKYSRLCSLYQYQQQLDLAEENINSAIDIHERLEREGKSSLSLKRAQAIYISALADILIARQENDAAEDILERHEKLCKQILTEDSKSTNELRQLAENQFSMAILRIGRWSELAEQATPARKAPEYLAVDQAFSESLGYLKKIEDAKGLDHHEEQFRNQVLEIRKVFEESVDKVDKLSNEEMIYGIQL